MTKEEKGVIAHFTCLSCENKVESKQILNQAKTGSRYVFQGPSVCPKCQAKGNKFKLVDFVSASVDMKIVADKL